MNKKVSPISQSMKKRSRSQMNQSRNFRTEDFLTVEIHTASILKAGKRKPEQNRELKLWLMLKP